MDWSPLKCIRQNSVNRIEILTDFEVAGLQRRWLRGLGELTGEKDVYRYYMTLEPRSGLFGGLASYYDSENADDAGRAMPSMTFSCY